MLNVALSTIYQHTRVLTCVVVLMVELFEHVWYRDIVYCVSACMTNVSYVVHELTIVICKLSHVLCLCCLLVEF